MNNFDLLRFESVMVIYFSKDGWCLVRVYFDDEYDNEIMSCIFVINY